MKKKNYRGSKSMERLGGVDQVIIRPFLGELSESVWEKTWYDVLYPCSSWIVKGVFIFLILSHSAPQARFYRTVSLYLVESCCLNSCSYSSNNKAVCLRSLSLPLFTHCATCKTQQNQANLSDLPEEWGLLIRCAATLVAWWHYVTVSHSVRSSNITRSHSLSPSLFALIEYL